MPCMLPLATKRKTPRAMGTWWGLDLIYSVGKENVADMSSSLQPQVGIVMANLVKNAPDTLIIPHKAPICIMWCLLIIYVGDTGKFPKEAHEIVKYCEKLYLCCQSSRADSLAKYSNKSIVILQRCKLFYTNVLIFKIFFIYGNLAFTPKSTRIG